MQSIVKFQIVKLFALSAGLLCLQTYANAQQDLNDSCFNNNNGKACVQLGLDYAKGNGVSKDINKANELFHKSCDLQDGSGCFLVSLSYFNGDGVAQDLNKASEFCQKGCELGSNDSCEFLKLQNSGIDFGSF